MSQDTSIKGHEASIKTRVINTLDQVNQLDWDRCLGESGSPFLRYSFLAGLERCGCVGGESGWRPKYILAELNSDLVGVTPAYIKYHSQGEFIFDWSWADAAHRAGMPYYPKLVVTSPFSPIGSEKLLCDPQQNQVSRKAIRLALLDALKNLTLTEELTGLHLLFISGDEADILQDEGLLRRHTLQFQWTNNNYQDFDDFLSRFRSKRRNQIKRERRRIRESGVTVKVYHGDEVKESHIPIIYQLYRTTVEKYFFGNLYLNYQFFKHLFETQREHICLLLAEKDQEVIGGSFNLVAKGVLYGRYWGINADVSIDYLHFEVCAYRGIEACIERGWTRFEAGAGGGGHKYGRGFLPRVIYSAHEVYLPGFKPALTKVLHDERRQIEIELNSIEGDIFKV